jgi:hypothetical protein
MAKEASRQCAGTQVFFGGREIKFSQLTRRQTYVYPDQNGNILVCTQSCAGLNSGALWEHRIDLLVMRS